MRFVHDLRLLRRGAVLAVFAAAAAPLPAQRADSAGAVVVAQALLRAISTRDTAAARAVMLPGAQFVSVQQPAPATARPRIQTDTDFFRTLPQGTDRLLERMWAPTVVLLGSLAEVRTPYDFHINGTFSHCGVDVFTLVEVRGEWRVGALAYTVQRMGCAASPLGPPAP